MAILRAMLIAALVIAASGPRPASAQISGASADTTGSSADESGGTFFRQSAATITGNTGTVLATQFTWNVSDDESTGNPSRTESGTAVHNLSFNVTAPGAYTLAVTTSRKGDLNRNCTGAGQSGNGAVDISGVTGSQTGGTVASGSLNLADPGAINSGTSNAELVINQTGASGSTAVINGTSNGVAKNHTLSFTWTGLATSNTCSAAVRMGESSSFAAGTYPGSPSRTQANDGFFVTITLTSLCGNGTVDSSHGEQCDEGANNGLPSSCCTSTCQFVTSGTECRPSAGICDPHEVCTGSSGSCPADALSPSTTTCRSSAGECDPAENCTGSSVDCPADAKSPSGTSCSSDGNPCTLDQCDGVSDACQHPAGNAGALCRASTGECDPAENCDGTSTSCPADARSPSGTACSSDGNPCTLDQCDGSSAACQHPAGNAGTTCRSSAGDCDIAETCTGTSTACPTDGFEPSSFVCRSSAGQCDVAESCPGTSADCPSDAKSTAECRPSAGDCDPAETCDGVSDDCPPDAKSTAVCRPAAGDCDVAESCDGSSNTCPADALAPSTQECRSSAGQCDVAE